MTLTNKILIGKSSWITPDVPLIIRFTQALDFSRLLPNDLEMKRRFLQCPECEGPAFFRNASYNGRACFGARPHAIGCKLAFQDCVVDEEESSLIHESNIIVDFQYGAAVKPDRNYGSECLAMQIRPRPNNVRQHTQTYRRLGSLLRTLIKVPKFSISYSIIEIEGRGEFLARKFFVSLQSATYHYSGQYCGYWGVISDAKLAFDKSLWLNSGGNDNISFCLDTKYVDIVFQRYGITELEELAGAYILVFGTPRVSQNGKLFCVIDGAENLALRMT